MTYSVNPDEMKKVQTALATEAMWTMIEVQEFQKEMLGSQRDSKNSRK